MFKLPRSPPKCKNFYIHLPTVSHGSSLCTQKSFLERKMFYLVCSHVLLITFCLFYLFLDNFFKQQQISPPKLSTISPPVFCNIHLTCFVHKYLLQKYYQCGFLDDTFPCNGFLSLLCPHN